MPKFRGAVSYGDDRVRTYLVIAPDEASAVALLAQEAEFHFSYAISDDLEPDELDELSVASDFDGTLGEEDA